MPVRGGRREARRGEVLFERARPINNARETKAGRPSRAGRGGAPSVRAATRPPQSTAHKRRKAGRLVQRHDKAAFMPNP